MDNHQDTPVKNMGKQNHVEVKMRHSPLVVKAVNGQEVVSVEEREVIHLEPNHPSIESPLKFDNDRCECCPYGYHVDVDFMRYLDALNSGSYLKKLKKIKRTKKKMRKSMEIFLQQQRANESMTAQMKDVLSNDQEPGSRGILDEIDSTANNTISSIDQMIMNPTMISSAPNRRAFTLDTNRDTTQSRYNTFPRGEKKTVEETVMAQLSDTNRSDSVSSLSSDSTTLSTASSEKSSPLVLTPNSSVDVVSPVDRKHLHMVNIFAQTRPKSPVHEFVLAQKALRKQPDYNNLNSLARSDKETLPVSNSVDNKSPYNQSANFDNTVSPSGNKQFGTSKTPQTQAKLLESNPPPSQENLPTGRALTLNTLLSKLSENKLPQSHDLPSTNKQLPVNSFPDDQTTFSEYKLAQSQENMPVTNKQLPVNSFPQTQNNVSESKLPQSQQNVPPNNRQLPTVKTFPQAQAKLPDNTLPQPQEKLRFTTVPQVQVKLPVNEFVLPVTSPAREVDYSPLQSMNKAQQQNPNRKTSPNNQTPNTRDQQSPTDFQLIKILPQTQIKLPFYERISPKSDPVKENNFSDSTQKPEQQSVVDTDSLHSMRDAMAASLQRMKELEEHVKAIPVLQTRISVLKEEKRLLQLHMRAKGNKLNTRSIGVGYDTIDNGPLESPNDSFSSDVFCPSPTPSPTSSTPQSTLAERFDFMRRSGRSKPPIKLPSKTVAVGNHDINDPYLLQPQLSDLSWIEQQIMGPQQGFIAASSPRHDISSDTNTELSLKTASIAFAKSLGQASPRSDQHPGSISDASLDTMDPNLHIHEKELKTLILNQSVSPYVQKRNVGVECKVSTRDVGVSYVCDDLKPVTRSVGVGDGDVFTPNQVQIKESDFKNVLQEVLSKNVRSIGVNCNVEKSVRSIGIMHCFSDTRTVGVGEDTIDEKVKPTGILKTIGVMTKPDVRNAGSLTDRGWRVDGSVNTDRICTESKYTSTDAIRKVNVATMTNPKDNLHATTQTRKVYIYDEPRDNVIVEETVSVAEKSPELKSSQTKEPFNKVINIITDYTTFTDNRSTTNSTLSTEPFHAYKNKTFETPPGLLQVQQTDMLISPNTASKRQAAAEVDSMMSAIETASETYSLQSSSPPNIVRSETRNVYEPYSLPNQSRYLSKNYPKKHDIEETAKFADSYNIPMVKSTNISLHSSSTITHPNTQIVKRVITETKTHKTSNFNTSSPILNRHVKPQPRSPVMNFEQTIASEMPTPIPKDVESTDSSPDSKKEDDSAYSDPVDSDFDDEDEVTTTEQYFVTGNKIIPISEMSTQDYNAFTEGKLGNIHLLGDMSSLLPTETDGQSHKTQSTTTSTTTTSTGKTTVKTSKTTTKIPHAGGSPRLTKKSKASPASKTSGRQKSETVINLSKSPKSESKTNSITQIPSKQATKLSPSLKRRSNKYSDLSSDGNTATKSVTFSTVTSSSADKLDNERVENSPDDANLISVTKINETPSASVLNNETDNLTTPLDNENLPSQTDNDIITNTDLHELNIETGPAFLVESEAVESENIFLYGAAPQSNDKSNGIETDTTQSKETDDEYSPQIQFQSDTTESDVDMTQSNLSDVTQSDDTDVLSANITDSGMVMSSCSEANTSAEDGAAMGLKPLKSCMKRSTSSEGQVKKEIKFSNTVVQQRSTSGSDDNDDNDDDDADDSDSDSDDSASSYDEGSYDGREGNIVYTCIDDQVIAQGTPGAAMFDQNIRETFEIPEEVKQSCQLLADYLVDSTTVQSKELIPEEVKQSCLLLADYLVDSTTVLSKELNESLRIIQKEWFKVAGTKLSDVYMVEDYLSSFNEISRRLIQYVVNMADTNGNTVLHYAVTNANLDLLTLLLDTEICDVDKQNVAGYSPIMLASISAAQSERHVVIVKRMFSMGNVNAVSSQLASSVLDNDCQTPLMLASISAAQSERHVVIVKRMFAMGNVNAVSSQAGQTALMLAVSHGREETVQSLLDVGAGINTQDEDGSTALMCACEHGYTEIVQILLGHPGCDANIADNDGSTALSVAMEAGHRDVGVLLYAHLNFSKQQSPFEQELTGNKVTETFL